MSDRPGCTIEGCTNRAAYMILYDDRLTDQYRCFEHTITDLERQIPTD